DMTKSTLWKPILRFPRSIDAETRTRLEAEYRNLMADEMFPALRRLGSFVRNETTTDLTPDEIHALGLSEVKRIQASLLAAAQKADFSGKMSDVRAWL